MKYKVGDKVLIVDHRTVCMNNEGKMDKWFGKVMTIRSVDENYKDYRMEEDYGEWLGKGWFWHDYMIQGLANQNKIVITTKGNEVTARLYDGKQVIKSEIAKCSPDDEFDFTTGAKIAFRRLTKPEEEKPKYYNGKVVCTGEGLDGYINTNGFTMGKTYQFKDGECIDDFRFTRPFHKVGTLEDFQKIVGIKFIELVEE